MKRFWMRSFLTALCLASVVLHLAAADNSQSVTGIYEGFWSGANGARGRITSQVRIVGQDKYDGFITFDRSRQLVAAVKMASRDKSESGAIPFLGGGIKSTFNGDLLPEMVAHIEIKNGKLTGTFKGELGEGTFEAEKIKKQSPTLGAKPPQKGKMIFDGKDTSQFESFPWKLTEEGAMRVQGGDIHAKDILDSFRLHLEFRTPLMSEAQGQARGNSGVYLQSKYEVQVLDSFGLFPLQNNDCGGIYQIAAPPVNACLPPGEWQTYDITYLQGNPPMISVVQNGIQIIDKVKIPEKFLKDGTTAASRDRKNFLKLQDHGNPVEYRNIWVEPITAE
ncbi:MAG: DUF1080 domain-containing protein [Verrucomicrobiota bacterium]|nr:DUF1080 domain-containing protein [Verrucomicrobiota bacterium]